MVDTPFSADFTSKGPRRYAPGSFGFVTERERAAWPELRVHEINGGFEPVWWYEGAGLTRVLDAPEGVFAAPGSDALAGDLEGRSIPLWFKADTGPGRYKITATVTSPEGNGEVLVFVSRRRLAWMGALAPGESRKIEALCDVSPIIASGGGDAGLGDLGRMEDRSVDLVLVGAGLRDVKIELWEGPAAFILGDSTVTDQAALYPYAPGVNYCGWGQMLQRYLGTSFAVSNHAHSGLSTETFREKGHFDVLRPQVRPGDLALIQFGHNDQKKKHLSAKTGFTDNLVRYIAELRALGAVPVLVTSLARNTWKSGTEYNDLLLDHARAALDVAEREGAAAVDLHEKMKSVLLAAGMEAGRIWYHPGDYSHPNDFGAYLAAGFVAQELRKLGLIPAFDVPSWPVHPPMAALEPPTEGLWHGNTPPAKEKTLTDYGLIPDFPWQIT